MSSKINIRDILSGHFKSLDIIWPFKGRIIPSGDALVFVWIPTVLSVLLCVFFLSPTEGALSYISTVLSIFIGLFLNLLVFLFSFLDNKHEVRDTINRYELIKQTFYNISFMIILCIFALIFVFLFDLKLNYLYAKWEKLSNLISANHIFFCWVNVILKKTLAFITYFSLIEIFLTLLMIMKRIGKLFSTELEHASKIKTK